ncbi:MAG: chorismate-binding protein [Bacteriovoracaceae bacterium]
MNFEQETFSLVKAGTLGFILFSRPKIAYLYYSNRRVNLLNGKSESYSFEELNQMLSTLDLKKKIEKRILHFYYEWGVLLKGLPVSNESPLLIDLEYSDRRAFSLSELGPSTAITLTFARALSEKNYEKEFNKVQTELLDGNCYQVNLTHKFSYHFKTENFLSFFKIWSDPAKRGAFAHATNLPGFSKLIISNTPECLWKMEKDKISTYPIKGTVKIEGGNKHEAEKILLASEKDRGELNMITDLMRNDLAYLSGGISYVLKDRVVLEVPGLLHCYSHVMTKSPVKLSLFKLMEALFPGGSITGAPKKRVMKIIYDLENHPRGIYCGSTVVLDGNIKAASLNIRTGVVRTQEKMFYYGAGGGVTLLSKKQDEYQEILSKITSFIQLLAQ